MRKLITKLTSFKNLISLLQLRGFMTRRRVVTASILLTVSILAILVYPIGKRIVWNSDPAQTLINPEDNPMESLGAMTDVQIREFAVHHRLPAELVPHDWIRAKIIREALREQLPRELVRRWDRDAQSLGASMSHTATYASGRQGFDATRPGVLGVQIADHGFGLRVTHVYTNSAASRAGLHVGDQILAVNRRQVNSQAALVAQLQTAASSGGHAEIEVQRHYARRLIRADVSGRSSRVARQGNLRY